MRVLYFLAHIQTQSMQVGPTETFLPTLKKKTMLALFLTFDYNLIVKILCQNMCQKNGVLFSNGINKIGES